MILRKVTQDEISGTVPELEGSGGTQTVSELTRSIRETLEADFREVTVQGEVSGWTKAASGHTYFTLKDEKAALSSVLWRNRRLPYPIENGMKVIATGSITVYPPRGNYQLDCHALMPLGQGALQLAFEQLKAKLHAEGLFDSARKRPLPSFPSVIGVVTSPTGAVIRDIITTVSRRMPSVKIILAPARVQGTGASEEIAQRIEQFNRHPEVDVLIVGRGGGSLEDLWAFNEERVARAIASSQIPVISAVGHETDFTIADFVADVRAATPTGAAELAVRDKADLLGFLANAKGRLNKSVDRKLALLKDRLRLLARSRGMHRPLDMLREREQRVDDLTRRSDRAMLGRIRETNEQINRLQSSLRALDPARVLKRGYAIVERDGAPIPDSTLLTTGDNITLRMRDGSKGAVIEEDR